MRPAHARTRNRERGQAAKQTVPEPDPHRRFSLEEAARTTGRSVEELRQWCATGRLTCEHVDGAWQLLERDLRAAAAMGPPRPGPASSGRMVLALAFADPARARRAMEQIRGAFDRRVQHLALAPLSLDGRTYSLVAGSYPDDGYPELESIARRNGGQIVDDVDEAWTRRQFPTAGPPTGVRRAS